MPQLPIPFLKPYRLFPLLTHTNKPKPALGPTTTLRPVTSTPSLCAEGDTGATRSGGSAHSDAFTKREKAAEDMWIRDREKNVIAVMREKIARQEAILEEDRKVLARMEDQYGHVAEGK